MYQQKIQISTQGRGSYDITAEVQSLVGDCDIETGLCHIFVHHTSASLMLCENADPAVRRDMERFMSRLVVDGDPLFEHVNEGPDDMPAHIRSVLTTNDMTLPVKNGRCDLGTWQGVYLWEHRMTGQRRTITITVVD
ncbi:MAG TPA: YjbQ family protein [Gammaproteobacteria bacterium]|nr:YjbQ family protein [Gammaproteobacteria bacterium]